MVGALSGLGSAIHPGTTVVHRAGNLDRAEPSGLGGVAEMVVRVWLLDEGQPAPGAEVALTVDAVSTVAIRRVASGHWAATVAASVRASAAGAATVWFVEVGIADSGHGPRPVGRPAIVPAPVTLDALEASPLTLAVPPPSDPIAATADAFLRSLLSGQGDPTRYVSPNAEIPPIGAAPFEEVRLERIAVIEAERGTRRVRVSTSATTAEQIIFELLYELTLRERDGRWEVTAISAATTLPAFGPQRSSTARAASETDTAAAVASPGA